MTTRPIARCPECDHPWSVHSLDGCDVGSEAPAGERCPCLRPQPRLPGEGVDEAEVRLGKVSGLAWTRLYYGSRAIERLEELLTAHFDHAADDLYELWGTLVDLEGYFDQLAEASSTVTVEGMSQAAVRDILARLNRAVHDAVVALLPVREVGDPGIGDEDPLQRE